MKKQARYGTWESPVTPDYVAGKEPALSPYTQCDGDKIYFIESRPEQFGRAALMMLTPGGTAREILPENFDVRTRYLEYSAVSFLIDQGLCYFVNFSDQEIYVTTQGELPRRLTSEHGHRFADLTMDRKRNRLIALRETPASPESKNSICAIDLKTGTVTDLITGSDFYSDARVHEDQMSWISWDHPNMPWNGTELWVAPVDQLKSPKKIAGDKTHSVAEARWGPAGEIYFLAELNNFVNLYRYKNGDIENLFSRDADFALPAWAPGKQQFALTKSGTLFALFLENGMTRIVCIEHGKAPHVLPDTYCTVDGLCAFQDSVVAVLGFTNKTNSIASINPKNAPELMIKELYSPKTTGLPTDFISIAQEIKFPTSDGTIGFAWYYPPKNPHFESSPSEKPPLMVCAHGGPTSFSPATFRKGYQFWTSRGYAVVDVNYGGSAGFGRQYRERLRSTWGIIDVNDCVAAVKVLTEKGLVDAKRVAIRGGSAGGYTTLAALTFTKDIFAVGASYFGVSDLEGLAKETHKLESRYLDQLVGEYPKDIANYKMRSPSEHVEKLNCPIIFFQGDEDKVVPPNQSELMYNALLKKKIPTEYHLYNKEGHGFRRADTNRHSLLAEQAFYARFFNIDT